MDFLIVQFEISVDFLMLISVFRVAAPRKDPIYPHHNSDFYIDSNKKRIRQHYHRTYIHPDQRRILQDFYEVNRFPDSEARKALAHMTGLSQKVIITWYRNYRRRNEGKI